MKNVLFINSGFDIGGIETFIVRAAKKLSNDIRFTLLIMSDAVNPKLLEEFKIYGEVIFLKDLLKIKLTNYAIVRTILPLNESIVKSKLSHINVIHASCSFSIALMRRLSQLLNNKVIESVGVYHSREFLWGDKNNSMRAKQLSIFNEIPEKNVVFMNDYTARLYSEVFNKNYTIALPIGIDTTKYNICKPDFNSCRIVSIGRLVDFKTYNKHMIKALHALKKYNNVKSFIFEIYGDGEEMVELKALAKNMGVETTFYGKLDYALMPSILDGAFLFVGCGTAIVEASAAGVPSIIGVESMQEPLSHGFLTQTQGLSFQEKGLNLKTYTYTELLNKLNSLTQHEYEFLSNEHRVRADTFSLQNMERVLSSYYMELEPIKFHNVQLGYSYLLNTFVWLIKNKLNLSKERNTMYDF